MRISQCEHAMNERPACSGGACAATLYYSKHGGDGSASIAAAHTISRHSIVF